MKVAKVKIYKDSGEEWRWSATAGNGEKVADSGEGYMSKHHAIEMAAELFPGAEVEVEA